MNRMIQRALAISWFVLGTGPAGPAVAQGPGPGFHSVALPSRPPAAPAGKEGKEVRVLLETPHVKLVAITLRGGTVLPEHSAPNQVTIQALSGAATVRLGQVRERVTAERMLVLAPGLAHEVTAEGTGDVVLLLHHVLGGPRGQGPGRGAQGGPGRP